MGNLIREQIPGDFCTKGEFTEGKAEQLIKQPQDTEKNRSNCPLSTTRWRAEKSVLSHVRKHVCTWSYCGQGAAALGTLFMENTPSSDTHSHVL